MTKLRHGNEALVYGDFELGDKKWKDVLSYYRKGEDGTFFIEMNLTDKPQKRKVSVKNYEKVISNVNAPASDTLSPFEANVYRVK